jgi:uncharacterized membrane protein YccC
MWCGIAAFWTCLVDPGGSIKVRIQAILSYILLASFSCLVAGILYPFGPKIVIPFAACWIFSGVIASSFGSSWAQVGSLNTVCFIVASGRPPIDGLYMPLLFLAGGAWAAVLTLVLWRIHPYRPLRRAVGEAFGALGQLSSDLSILSRRDYEESSWTAHASIYRKATRAAIEAARSAVVYTPRLSGKSSQEGDRLRFLVEIADQMFAQYIALSDLLEAYNEAGGEPLPADLARSLRRLTSGLTGISTAFTATGMSRSRRLDRASSLINSAAEAASAQSTSSGPWLTDIRKILTTLSDRLKVIITIELEYSSVSEFKLQAPPPVVNVQKAGIGAVLQENLSTSSSTFHHALRAMVTGTIAVAIMLIYKIPFGYWLAMTTVLVLQPFVALTWPRAAERVLGSALGGVIAAFSGMIIHSSIEHVLLISILAFVTMAVRPLNYTLFIFFLTPMFVLVVDLGHPAPMTLQYAEIRVFNTILGSMLALLGGLIFWPNWEIGRLPQELAKVIEANTAYVLAVLTNIENQKDDKARTEVKARRRDAGLASNKAEASLQRLLMEPRANTLVDTNAATAVLAAVRRMGGASAALWLGEGTSSGVTPAAISAEIEWLKAASEQLAEAVRTKRRPEPLPEIGLPLESNNSTDLPVRIARQMQIIHNALDHLFAVDTGRDSS